LPQEFDSTIQNEAVKDHKFHNIFVGDIMMHTHGRQHRSVLQSIARWAMLERGLLPDFPPQALAELNGINGPAIRTEESTRDLRRLAWCSIDNDDSRDLDQLTVANATPGGGARILVAIADVDAIVKKLSALDDHGMSNIDRTSEQY
jgi:exoribonuclease II